MSDRPVQPGFLPVYEAELDARTLGELRRDLEQCAEVVQVQVRRAVVAPDDRRVDVACAFELLLDGSLHSVQVRYRHQGHLWCDTLLMKAHGIRLIRMKEYQRTDEEAPL